MRVALVLAVLLSAGCLDNGGPSDEPTGPVGWRDPCQVGTAPAIILPPMLTKSKEPSDPPAVGTRETPLGPPPADVALLSNSSLVLRHRYYTKAMLVVDVAHDPDNGEPWLVTLGGVIVRGSGMQDEVLNRSATLEPLAGESGLLAAETFVLEGAPRLAIVEATPDKVLRLVSFPLVGEPGARRPDIAAPRVHLERSQNISMHFGGDLAWHDGWLYLSLGDGKMRDSDGQLVANNNTAPFGKLVRVDPATNAVEVLARGLRNPWRFALDADCGNLLVTDVGEAAWEEVNVLPADPASVIDFGWDREEGPAKNANATTGPAIAYDHDEARCAISGAAFRPRTADVLPGTFVFADLCTGEVWSYQPGTGRVTLLVDLPESVYSVRSTLQGETLILTANWAVLAGEVLVLATAAPPA